MSLGKRLAEQHKELLSSPNVKRAIDYYNINNSDRITILGIAHLVAPEHKPETAYYYLKEWSNGNRLGAYRHWHGLRLCQITGLPLNELYKKIEHED